MPVRLIAVRTFTLPRRRLHAFWLSRHFSRHRRDYTTPRQIYIPRIREIQPRQFAITDTTAAMVHSAR